MATEFNDLLGVLSVIAYLAGIGAVTVRTILLCWRLRGADSGIRFLPALLGVAGALYIGCIAVDVSSVVAVLSNTVNDIPPSSTFRAAVFGVFTWTLHSLLFRLAKGRLN